MQVTHDYSGQQHGSIDLMIHDWTSVCVCDVEVVETLFQLLLSCDKKAQNGLQRQVSNVTETLQIEEKQTA